MNTAHDIENHLEGVLAGVAFFGLVKALSKMFPKLGEQEHVRGDGNVCGRPAGRNCQ